VAQKGAKPFSAKQSSAAKVSVYKMIKEGNCKDTNWAPIVTASECKTADKKLNLPISREVESGKWKVEVATESDENGNIRPERCWYSSLRVGEGWSIRSRWPLCKTAGDAGVWQAIDGDRKTCAKTSDYKPWLEVDLGSTYTITGFSLARPSACPSFDIFVMNEECLSRSECKGKQLCKRQNDDATYVSEACDVSIVGSKIRMESIPENGKKKCSGGLEVCELAFTGSYKIDGGVGEWAAWSSCDKSCGPGVQTRTRACNHPTPAQGGLMCPEDQLKSSQACETVTCVGQWAQWEQWSAAASVVNTLRHRIRKCLDSSCPTDGITKQNNVDAINQCNGNNNSSQEYDEAFIAKLLEKMNIPNLKWNDLLGFFKETTESFEKEIVPKCLKHGGTPYTAQFYCSLGKGKAQEIICKYYLWYERMVTSIRNEDDTRSADAKKRRDSGPIVKTTIDYKTLLINKIRDDQFSEQTKNMNDIKDKMASIDKSFRQDFGGYLSQIASFDYEIANQDKLYIATVIEMWQKEIDQWIGKITHMLKVAVGTAIAKSAADMADQIISVVDELAGSMNPFAWLSGSADMGDVLDAATDVADGVKDIAAMAHIMKSLLDLAQTVDKIKEGMGKNKELHEYFLKLTAVDIEVISNDEIIDVAVNFTNAYGNFFPGIKLSDIAKLIATFEGILDTACDEINEADSAIGSGISTGMTIAGYCTGTTIGPMLAQLDSALQESYDAQYELMDAGAAMAKALIAGSLSRTIQTNFADNDKTPTSGEYVKGLLYMYMHRRNTLASACDAIEYENFGEENSDCTTLRNDPRNKKSLEMLSQLATKKDHTGCDLNDRHITIPASTKGSKLKGTVNLLDLYEKGNAMFTIPSPEYAKKRGWIAQRAKDSQVFVSKFMLILPPSSSDPSERSDEISITHAGANVVNGKPYFLKTKEFNSIYKYNPLMNCRSMNPPPYQVPNCPNPYHRPPCATSEGVTGDVYLPSLYGDWKISLYNNQKGFGMDPLTLPNVTDTLYLQARVKTCTPKSQKKRDQKLLSDTIPRAPRMRRSETVCCASKGEMWNSQSKVYGECKTCPAPTVPANQGYYCKHVRCYNKNDCCSPQNKCKTGEGKCSSDNDCFGKNKCGENKCSWKGANKCCYLPIAAKKDTPAKVGLTPDEFAQKFHLSKDEEKAAEIKGVFDQAVEELSK
jgi:hypothetical protein